MLFVLVRQAVVLAVFGLPRPSAGSRIAVRLVSSIGKSTGDTTGGEPIGSSPSASDRDLVTTRWLDEEEFAIIDGTDEAKDGTTGVSGIIESYWVFLWIKFVFN